LVARPCDELGWWNGPGPIRLRGSDVIPVMLRVHGDRDSLLATLAAHWADQQLQIPTAFKPLLRPIRRRPRLLP